MGSPFACARAACGDASSLLAVQDSGRDELVVREQQWGTALAIAGRPKERGARGGGRAERHMKLRTRATIASSRVLGRARG